MVNDSWPTEKEPECRADLDQASEEPSSVCCNDHPHTGGGGDMRAVPSRRLGMAHTGHMPGLPGDSASHPSEEEKLRSTAHKRDGLLLLKEVTWHLRGDGGGV